MKGTAAVGASGADDTGWAAILQNIIIGLTVSFIALSLGAALGMLSGRGAFAGMLSAGIIALVTAALGGTRVQCSGPTAPMSAVSAITVAFAVEHAAAGTLAGTSPTHFINLVFLLCGAILLLMGIFRLGRFIALVPNVVISGFMNGIALLIWIDQTRVLFGLHGKAALAGPVWQNALTALTTLVLIFTLAPLTRMFVGRAARFLPATLLAIVLTTLLTHLLHWPLETIHLTGGLSSLADLGALLSAQWPSSITGQALVAALPFALQLALLGYLDTLLTSLVIDKISGETTRQNKELFAQGVANGAVGLLGGIPGAQATIRSVLMLKENATLRLAGMMVGVFVLIEMVLFQDLISTIPKAVFVGVLFKVGYDVLDILPLRLYAKEFVKQRSSLLRAFLSRHDDAPIFVTNREMLMILGASVVTVVADLNTAVVGFTLLFYLHNKVLNRGNPMRDLKPPAETQRFMTQN